jgi:hypothetical protein
MKTRIFLFAIGLMFFLSSLSSTNAQLTGTALELSNSSGPYVQLFRSYSYLGSTKRDKWKIIMDDYTGIIYFKFGTSTTTNNPTLSTKFTLGPSGNLNMEGDVMAGKFTDDDNGNYYLDPANTGTSLRVAGTIISEDAIEVVDLNSKFLNTEEIKTKKLNVEVNNVADYVFADDYKLRSLSEVEQFVSENKHLPDVPSADELEETGMNVAEMNNLLLQKVEELTLYIIDLEKRLAMIEK